MLPAIRNQTMSADCGCKICVQGGKSFASKALSLETGCSKYLKQLWHLHLLARDSFQAYHIVACSGRIGENLYTCPCYGKLGGMGLRGLNAAPPTQFHCTLSTQCPCMPVSLKAAAHSFRELDQSVCKCRFEGTPVTAQHKLLPYCTAGR